MNISVSCLNLYFLRTNTNKINRENNVRKFLSNKENVKTKFLWFKNTLCLFMSVYVLKV